MVTVGRLIVVPQLLTAREALLHHRENDDEQHEDQYHLPEASVIQFVPVRLIVVSGSVLIFHSLLLVPFHEDVPTATGALSVPRNVWLRWVDNIDQFTAVGVQIHCPWKYKLTSFAQT